MGIMYFFMFDLEVTGKENAYYRRSKHFLDNYQSDTIEHSAIQSEGGNPQVFVSEDTTGGEALINSKLVDNFFENSPAATSIASTSNTSSEVDLAPTPNTSGNDSLVPTQNTSGEINLESKPNNLDPITGLPNKSNSPVSTYIISFKDSLNAEFPAQVAGLLQELGVPNGNGRTLDAIEVLIVELPDTAAQKLSLRSNLNVEADQEVSILAPPPGKGPNKEPDDGGGGGDGDSSSQLTVWNNTINPLLSDPDWNVAEDAVNNIFILDTGISIDTGDLNINGDLSADFTGSSRKVGWKDQNGHGTHVAGTAAAENDGDGIAGIAAGAPVVSVKVLNRRGSGTMSGVLDGLNHVATVGQKGDVANLSLGLNGTSEQLDNAIRSIAAEKGILFAVAAGNDGKPAIGYSPAFAAADPDASGGYVDGVYAIAAHSENGTLASFSNYGYPVEFSAPGVSIDSLGINGSIVNLSGTSMATPAAAGQLYLTGGLQGTDQITREGLDWSATAIQMSSETLA